MPSTLKWQRAKDLGLRAKGFEKALLLVNEISHKVTKYHLMLFHRKVGKKSRVAFAASSACSGVREMRHLHQNMKKECREAALFQRRACSLLEARLPSTAALVVAHEIDDLVD